MRRAAETVAQPPKLKVWESAGRRNRGWGDDDVVLGRARLLLLFAPGNETKVVGHDGCCSWLSEKPSPKS